MHVTHLVAGMGEVGRAVYDLLSEQYDVGFKDLNHHSGATSTNYLHVCFPYGSGFETAVRSYIDQYTPQVTVVHSTVPVGTCADLNVCHSPVRGKHPHLVESLKTFVKFFGGVCAQDAAQEFARCGVTTTVVDSSNTTEAGKLWELLMYGLAIAQQKEMYRWCQEHGADPDVAYQDFARTYNEGYAALGEERFVRPIISNESGPIGGHCIIQNSPMINHPLSAMLRHLNNRYRE